MRLVDNFTFGVCNFDMNVSLLLKLCSMELSAQATPHTDAKKIDDDIPPIWFVRAMIGATALDDLNRLLVREIKNEPFDWKHWLDL